jgi:hypothetical protein
MLVAVLPTMAAGMDSIITSSLTPPSMVPVKG